MFVSESGVSRAAVLVPLVAPHDIATAQGHFETVGIWAHKTRARAACGAHLHTSAVIVERPLDIQGSEIAST